MNKLARRIVLGLAAVVVSTGLVGGTAAPAHADSSWPAFRADSSWPASHGRLSLPVDSSWPA